MAKQSNGKKRQSPSVERQLALTKADYFDSNNCDQSHHYFARDGENHIQAYHAGDDSVCESAKFRFTQMLNDEVGRAYRCPWCGKNTTDTEHMRACSGYQTPASKTEILDAYSHPAEQAKRDSLLREIER